MKDTKLLIFIWTYEAPALWERYNLLDSEQLKKAKKKIKSMKDIKYLISNVESDIYTKSEASFEYYIKLVELIEKHKYDIIPLYIYMSEYSGDYDWFDPDNISRFEGVLEDYAIQYIKDTVPEEYLKILDPYIDYESLAGDMNNEWYNEINISWEDYCYTL